MEINKSQAASFTGHRIIAKADLQSLRNELDKTINDLISKGILIYISGGAIGFDTLASQAVLKAREHNPNIKLIMALPCYEQEARWREADKKVYRYLLENADTVFYVSEQTYYRGCMEKRNRFLSEHSSVCVAYMTHGSSGTSQTVRFSRESGLTVINLAEEIKGGESMVEFEKAFSDYIDAEEYDKADEAFMEMLFITARSSFKAGFLAAGGEVPQQIDGIKYTRPSRVIPFNLKKVDK